MEDMRNLMNEVRGRRIEEDKRPVVVSEKITRKGLDKKSNAARRQLEAAVSTIRQLLQKSETLPDTFVDKLQSLTVELADVSERITDWYFETFGEPWEKK